LVLRDAHGAVCFYSIPYAEPSTVRQCLECTGVTDHNAAMNAILARVRGEHPADSRSVVIAHAFVAGGRECESERPLSVGGAGTVDAGAFAGFHYTALGHLHCPQAMAGGTIRYCGSPMSYSFDESGDTKGIHVVDMNESGAVEVETVALRPRRAVRRVSGLMSDLLQGPAEGESKDDYLEAMITDAGPVLDAMGRLREVYPNVLHIRRPEHERGAAEASDRPNIRAMDDAQLFKAFYSHVTGSEVTPEQEAAFVRIVDELRQREREGNAERADAKSETVVAL
jgi:exonuclease SbcD